MNINMRGANCRDINRRCGESWTFHHLQPFSLITWHLTEIGPVIFATSFAPSQSNSLKQPITWRSSKIQISPGERVGGCVLFTLHMCVRNMMSWLYRNVFKHHETDPIHFLSDKESHQQKKKKMKKFRSLSLTSGWDDMICLRLRNTFISDELAC